MITSDDRSSPVDETLAARAAEVEQLVHTDPGRAEQLMAAVTAAAVRDGDLDVEARVTYALARVRAERGELDHALALIDRACDLWLEADRPLAVARTDLGRMQILDDLGRHVEALRVGDALLLRLDALAGTDPDASRLTTIRAAALGNIGVAFSFLGQHDASLSSYEESEHLYSGLGMPVQVAQQRANRAIELLALGRAREALVAMSSAEREFRAAGDSLWAAKCATHLAEAHQQLGDIVVALRTLEAARHELVTLGATAEEARVHLQLSRVQLEAGLLPEAAESARQAVRLSEQAGMAHDAAFGRLVLASAHLRAGRSAEALGEAEACVRTFDDIGDEQFLARAHLLLAQIGVAQHDPRADDLLTEAVDRLERGGWQVPLAWALLERGQSLDERGRACLARAAQLVDDLAIPSLSHALAVRRGAAARAAGRLDEAIELLIATVEDIDVRGRRIMDPVLRVAVQNDATAAHDLLVDLLVSRDGPGDVADALRVSDAARAQTLQHLLTTGPSPTRVSSAAGHEGSETQELASDLSAVYSAMAGASKAVERAALLRRARSIEARLGTRRMGSVLGGPVQDAAPPASPRTDFGTALVYHVVDQDVIAFVVGDQGEVAARRLAEAVPGCERLLGLLAAQWTRFAIGGGFTDRHAEALEGTARAVLRDLHELLVAPLRPLLEALTTRELTVVPHKLLHRVPFAALHDGERYLIEQWTVSLSPLVPPSRVAPPVPTDSEQVLVLAVPDRRAPMILAESERIVAVAGDVRLLSEERATSTALRDALPGPDIVHLACHGLHRPDNPTFSALRLADRWLTAADLLELDLSGALLTLSACESGEADHRSAEPLGLAWAGIGAGARGVVVSQWVLDDAVAVELMEHLYRRLADHATAAGALREAQLAVARAHGHPYFWAPLTLVVPMWNNERTTP